MLLVVCALFTSLPSLARAAAAGVKLDLQTLQKRGGAALASYRMVWTALRRLHGKESVLEPLWLAMQR